MADLIETYPRIGRALWGMTLVKLSITQEWLASTGRGADKQLAHVFCELLVRLRAVGLADENGFEFGLTQGDIADVVGISHVHVNRVLQSLRSSGLIVFSQYRLTVPDVERLYAFGVRPRLPALWKRAALRPSARAVTMSLLLLSACNLLRFGILLYRSAPNREGLS